MALLHILDLPVCVLGGVFTALVHSVALSSPGRGGEGREPHLFRPCRCDPSFVRLSSLGPFWKPPEASMSWSCISNSSENRLAGPRVDGEVGVTGKDCGTCSWFGLVFPQTFSGRQAT